jgi:hypothetical protein
MKKGRLVMKKERSGARNLVILGIASVVVATLTTGVSLAIYHNSGDIYLDRSRPGYLPDEQEIVDKEEQEKELEYEFEKSGKMSMEVLEEYLENLEKEIQAVDDYEKPFGQGVMSDDQLGIPAE